MEKMANQDAKGIKEIEVKMAEMESRGQEDCKVLKDHKVNRVCLVLKVQKGIEENKEDRDFKANRDPKEIAVTKVKQELLADRE